MNFKLNADKTAAVALDTYWIPIDENTPVGVKMQLINRKFGIATTGIYRTGHGWTHWYPVPRFKD